MRIIAGEFRSRRLFTPPDDSVTRPIPDRVKESVFGLLRGHIEGSEIFDAFAGTGAIGLEALSRGARRVVFVEQSRQIAAILRQNIEHFKVQDRSELVNSDALGIGAISRCPSGARVIFLDPPYPLVRDSLGWRRVVGAMQQLAPNLTDDGFLVLRTPWPLFETEAIEPEPAAHRGWKKGKKGSKDEDTRIRKGHWDELLDPGAKRKRGTPDPREIRRGSRKPGSGAFNAGSKGLREAGETPFGDEWEEMDLEDVMPPAQAEEDGEDAPAEAPSAPKPHKLVDVKVAGLRGPETHVYGSMAVHLYMRG